MATNVQYKFYQVSNAYSSGNLSTTYQAAGNIIFDKTTHTITICKDTNRANNTLYGGGLKTASFANGVLTIEDWDGNSVTLNTSDFVKSSDLNGKADKSTTLSGYGITDAFTKTETQTEITNAIEKFGDILTLRGTVTSYDDLPTTNRQKGDVYQVTKAGTIPTVYFEQNGALTTLVSIPEKSFEANAELYWVPRSEGDYDTGTSMLKGYIPAHWDILGNSIIDTSNFVDKEELNDLETRVAVVEELTGAGSSGSGESLADKISAIEDRVSDLEDDVVGINAALCWVELN